MGIITLTDRISVSVRAKNETESNSQKRATGRNIANALTSGGNANISDSLADELGNTSKPTIADEQGREWVAMSDIIAAGKKMQQEGAFGEETPAYDELTYNGSTIYVLSGLSGGGITDRSYWDGAKTVYENKVKQTGVLNGSFAIARHSNSYVFYPLEGDVYRTVTTYWTTKSASTINAKALTAGHYTFADAYNLLGVTGSAGTLYTSPDLNSMSFKGYLSELSDRILEAAYRGEVIHHPSSGGSLIDWTKPDDEIEEDIRNLHETWDVSDHAGSVNANGTYVLAGPIEFNPGD